MKMVSDWRSFLRWYSTWANAALVSVGATWLMVPEDMRAAVPPEWLAAAAVVLAVGGSVGRIIKQK